MIKVTNLTPVFKPIYEGGLLTFYNLATGRKVFLCYVFNDHLNLFYSAGELGPVVPSKCRRRDFKLFGPALRIKDDQTKNSIWCIELLHE